MRATPERPLSFGRSSHVRTYWLLHSTGFRVRGRRLRGVVETVQGRPSEAHALVVRRGLLRRRLVLPADAVEAVVPDAELLVVDGPPARRRLRPLRRARRAVAPHFRALVRSARAEVARLWAAGAALGRFARAYATALGVVALAYARAIAVLVAMVARAALAWLRGQLALQRRG
jgi:hypothetical protein